MKIAYLTQVDLHSHSGIRTKHIMQARAWSDLGHEVCFFSVPNRINYTNPLPFPFPIKQYDSALSRRLLAKPSVAALARKILTTGALRAGIREYRPDVVYLRSLLWYPGIERVLEGNVVVLEGNTLYRDELKVAGSVFSRMLNAYGEPRICKKLSGVVGVTTEITRYYQDMGRELLGVTIGNGFDYSGLTVNGNGHRPNEVPNIVFVGTPGMAWHGVDHFYRMAELLPEMQFHLVGPVLENGYKLLPNIIQHGFMESKKLFELYSTMDIAVGSLALYRNNMQEGSTLKVREYAALGLPIIVSHKDVDLSGHDFILELEGNDQAVDKGIEQIRAFIQKWKNRRVPAEVIRPLIDYKLKEQKKIDFFQHVINSRRS